MDATRPMIAESVECARVFCEKNAYGMMFFTKSVARALLRRPSGMMRGASLPLRRGGG
ncbi:MAG: hypothetical protein REJ50_00790 [Bordetella sp.]|uniref:hypothetical protein n=1 Tax=Bordetella genomosp. 1 TaxID=1395607 RepID=UPI0015C5C303|nr:hypothetical protein [Bordetella genomosp. 1]MDQ8030523.1 hypothetical protein [Bordetella sp.]